MNFDVFDEIDFPKEYKSEMINSAKFAERNVFVSPDTALFKARVALESLCKGLINKELDESVNLSTMIDICTFKGFFKKKDEAHQIRISGNNVAHGNGDAEDLHIVNSTNVKLAKNSVRNLFYILSEVFPDQANGVKFNVNSVPFDSYEVVRKVEKSKNEVVFGKFNYFVKDSKNNYYYFQVLPRNSKSSSRNDLGARSVLTENRIKDDKKRTSYLLESHYPFKLSPESDRDYIAYPVYSDSKLLTEVEQGTLKEKQVVQIALDILNELLELKKIGNGIHLRNIQPGNVIVTPNGDDYMASAVNMETAKINNYDATVFGSMKNLVIDKNPYIPNEVRQNNEGKNISWEKVDVYSVAVLMVYCVDRSAVKDKIETDILIDYFSEKIADILADIFDSSLNEIDGIEELKVKLEDALEEL